MMSDNGVVSHVRLFLGLYDIEVLYEERHKKFLIHTGTFVNNISVNTDKSVCTGLLCFFVLFHITAFGVV